MDSFRPIVIDIQPNKKVYFTSDHHLGAPNHTDSLSREKALVKWLKSIENDAQVLFLMGDLFDFWHEYKYVIPKGFVRVLGQLATMSDNGIDIYFFTGNHDLWIHDYFQKELGWRIYNKKCYFKIANKTFLLAHGDGLGPNDFSYKCMRRIFRFSINRWLFRWLHPDWGMALGRYLSMHNKLISDDEDLGFLGTEKELLIQYVTRKQNQNRIDYYVFGHRHLALDMEIIHGGRYINLGEWIHNKHYAVFNGTSMVLQKLE